MEGDTEVVESEPVPFQAIEARPGSKGPSPGAPVPVVCAG